MKTYFNLDEKLKKIFNYFSIFTIVLGTTFGSISSSHAATLTLTGGSATLNLDADTTDTEIDDEDFTAGDDISVTTGAATITIDSTDSQLATGGFTVGAITDTGVAASLAITIDADAFDALDDDPYTITLGSANIDGSFAMTVADDADDDPDNIKLVVTNASSFGTTFLLSNLEATNAVTTTATFSSDLTVLDGLATINAVGADGTPDVNTATVLEIKGNASFYGADEDFTEGVSLNEIATHEGTAKILFSGATTQTVRGEIDGAAAGEGTIETSTANTNVTFSEEIGQGFAVKTIKIGASTEATFSAILSTETFDLDNDVTFGENNNVIGVGSAGALQIATGSVITIDDTIAAGETVIVATGNTAGATGVVVSGDSTVKLPSNFTTGTITLIDGDVALQVSVAELADILVTDTALTDYTVAHAGGVASNEDVTITAAAKTAATTASELSVTTNMAKALKEANLAAKAGSSSDSGAVDGMTTVLNAGTTTDTTMAQQVAPQDDMISGSTFATKAMTGSVQGIMSNRMAALRSGDAYYGSGMSAGSLSANSGFIQVFGSDVEQKNKTVGSGTQFGYDASTAGIALGFDGITDGGTVVGLSLSTSQSDVDGKGTGNSKNDIDSYTASIYMDKSTDAGYIEGSLTIGMNENSTSRIVNTGGLDRTYKGDYDSYQASLNISGGAPKDTGNGFVTPFGGVSATQIQTERYRETSSTAGDNLRLTVDQDDVTSIVGTVGVKYHNVLDNGGVPMISLAVNNEFGDNTIESTNTYQGGGTSFKTSTDVEELSATLGLGYTFASDNTTLELSYEADANDDDYLSHYGSIKIVGKF